MSQWKTIYVIRFYLPWKASNWFHSARFVYMPSFSLHCYGIRNWIISNTFHQNAQIVQWNCIETCSTVDQMPAKKDWKKPTHSRETETETETEAFVLCQFVKFITEWISLECIWLANYSHYSHLAVFNK